MAKVSTPLTADAGQSDRRRVVWAGIVGNVMEWYDFAIYGFFARTIGSLFFPAEDPLTSLLAAYAVFAVGFFMIGRPSTRWKIEGFWCSILPVRSVIVGAGFQ